MPIRSLLTRAFALLTMATAVAVAQEPTPPADTTQNAALRAFLDCNEGGCDRDFLVTEIRWVNWMRDRADADFHLLVTSQTTGSGGRRYTVVAIGQRSFAGSMDTLTFTSNPNDASDTIRRALQRVLSQLLFPHAARGALGSRLAVSYTPPSGLTAAPAAAVDRWNFWTYSISANGNLSGESQQSFLWTSANLSANRTTADWKIRSSANYSYNESNFSLGSGGNFTALQRNYGASGMAVKSYGEHWSAGGRVATSSSVYNNTDLSLQGSAALEWDYFPYETFTRRRLTVLYTAGVRGVRYREITVYDKTSETRPVHTLDITYGARQPWGSANVTLNGSQYLDGLKYYNAGIWGGVDLRIGRGLSFNVSGQLSRVRDQLYLQRAGASDEEVIARLQALQTNYRYYTSFGIRYQFGSIFNSVVNPRFGNISGGEFF